MSEEETPEEVVEETPEEVVEEAAPEVKEAPKPKKKEVPKDNSMLFRAGEEMEVGGYPFVVKEVRGLDLVLKRTDLK